MKSLHSFSRSESEIETARDREREVKRKNNSREFSRNENLAGLCRSVVAGDNKQCVNVITTMLQNIDSVKSVRPS